MDNVFSILIQIGLENVAWELTKTILSMYRLMITQQINKMMYTPVEWWYKYKYTYGIYAKTQQPALNAGQTIGVRDFREGQCQPPSSGALNQGLM
jgi:hypothetical protein